MVASVRTRLRDVVQSPSQSVLVGVAAVGVVVANLIPVARGLFEVVPVWLSLLQFGVGVGLLGLTGFAGGFRSLRTLAVAVVTIQAQWLLFQFDVSGELFDSVIVSEAGDVLLAEGVELAPVLVALVVLGATGYSRSDLLLRISERSQTTDFTWVPGVRTEWSWRRAALCIGAALGSVFPAIRVLGGVSYTFGVYSAGELAVIIPVVLLAAAMNSFQERVVYAAIPLRELTDTVGQSTAVFLLAASFGLSHYTGTPGGPIGVLVTGILGWVLAKVMIETGSIAAAWVIHWLLDITIFSAVLT